MAEQGRDFYKDTASKIFGIPYEEVTEEHRSEAKNLLMNHFYGRAAIYPTQDSLITAKLLETPDSDNSLKNLYNRFIRNLGEVD